MTDYEKLKVELSSISSILEKFPTELKPQVFDLLIQSFIGKYDYSPDADKAAQATIKQKQDINPGINTKSQPKNSQKTRSKKSSASKKTVSESYIIDRNLNLRGGNGIPSFKFFYEEKQPSSAAELNTLAIYYLKQLVKLEAVTLNHVYTCYKEISRKPPEYFKQSIIDTKNKKGYVEFDDNWNLTIPHRGVSFIEHDLPIKKKST